MVTNLTDVHFAFIDTFSAIYTLRLFKLDAKDRELVEYAVQSSEGAEETAEETVDKYARQNEAYKECKLPGKERTEHSEARFVDLV